VIIPSRLRGLCLAVAAVAAIGGALVAVHYHRLGLTLSHYDARGHLIVARRILDSITPGWQQVGAVWLPLPHLVNALPVQVDAWYRTGASAVAFSIAAFALTAGSIAWIVVVLAGSRAAAVTGAAVFALNPNVLYLQATPMTEPLLFGLTTLAVALLLEWLISSRVGTASVGIAFALACLTRYEAWPVTAMALTAAAWARWRKGDSWRAAIHRVLPIALYPGAAVLAFVVFSRVVIGVWLVPSGFFVPENPALGSPWVATSQIIWGVRMLSGYGLMAVGIAGLIGLLLAALLDRGRAHLLVPLALAGTAAVPWIAFIDGHPYRIRYLVPLVVAQAVGVGAAGGLVKRFRTVILGALLALVAYELRPLDATAPMVVEAQWDRPNMAVRQQVTDCLRTYSGNTIMASMGSLGHYMQELSHAGFRVRDFLHEGNGDIWLAALAGPRPYAGWILIEEQAEGGDMLAHIAHENPRFLDGFSRVCEGAGVALYRRNAEVRTQN
jgi:hypothetical protein